MDHGNKKESKFSTKESRFSSLLSRKGERKKSEKNKKEFLQLTEKVIEEPEYPKQKSPGKDNKDNGMLKMKEEKKASDLSIKSAISRQDRDKPDRDKVQTVHGLRGGTSGEQTMLTLPGKDDMFAASAPSPAAKAGRRSFAMPRTEDSHQPPKVDKTLHQSRSGSPVKHVVQPRPGSPVKHVARGWGESNVAYSGVDRDCHSDKNSDSIDIVPVIPDLEEVYEEDFAMQVAVAPNKGNIVATYKELDHDLLEHAGLLTLDNEVDLKLLTKCLWSRSEVTDEDKPWDWANTFTEVTSQMFRLDTIEE